MLQIHEVTKSPYAAGYSIVCTVHDRQMGHVNQVSHLSKAPLNLLEIHEIGPVDTSESIQQNYDEI